MPRPALHPKASCPGCGEFFRQKPRGTRIQRTCSLQCHLATRRDYSGEGNPNYRHGQKKFCDGCGKEFVGVRQPTLYHTHFCSRTCSSMFHRGGNRRDANEAELLKAAKELGAFWYEGPPLDGWLWHRRTGFIPIEIKRPHRKGTAREFTKLQLKFFNECKASEAPYLVWRTLEDVIRDLGAKE